MRKTWFSSWKSAIRQLLPPTVYIVLAVLAVAIVELIWWVSAAAVRNRMGLDPLLVIRDHLIVFLLTAYGVFRVAAFHPLFRNEYRGWLERTPWQPGIALPLGPVRLAWADLFIVGSVACLLEDPREITDPDLSRLSALAGLLAFLQAHSLALAVVLWLIRPRGLAYLAMFLAAVSVRLSVEFPIAAILALAGSSIVAHLGLTQSWHLFPWTESRDWVAQIQTGWKSMKMRAGNGPGDDISPDRVPPADLGWPFGVCSPYQPPEFLTIRDRLLVGLLAGFWCYAVCSVVLDKLVFGLSAMLLLYGTIALMGLRAVGFGGSHASPMNFFGRLRTFRWIIPAYDKCVVGPLSIFAVAVVGGLTGFFGLQIPLRILTPLMVTLTIWTAALAGPTPRVWKLTAPARLVPGRLNKNTFEELS